jgi:phosphatidylethanolamine/phosphatidyl-N-methylethanolamine N-methyltransferase
MRPGERKKVLGWPTFFAQWLRQPLGIGSVLPSGRSVGRAVARLIDCEGDGAILELGGGTGSLTRGMLEAGCPSDRLVVIERAPNLARVLASRYPDVRVVVGDAADLGAILARLGIDRVAVVVSSLPIKWFPFELHRAIVEQSFAVLEPGGYMLQLTNARASPIPMQPLGLEGRVAAHVWWNLLPIHIWRYHRNGVAHPQEAPAALDDAMALSRTG